MPPRQRLSVQQLRELARDGAERAVKRLRAEIIAIERTFPELALPRRRRQIRRSVAAVQRRSRRLSKQARAALSARMKKYWAERRKAQSKVR